MRNIVVIGLSLKVTEECDGNVWSPNVNYKLHNRVLLHWQNANVQQIKFKVIFSTTFTAIFILNKVNSELFSISQLTTLTTNHNDKRAASASHQSITENPGFHHRRYENRGRCIILNTGLPSPSIPIAFREFAAGFTLLSTTRPVEETYIC